MSGWFKLHRKALGNPHLREPDAFRFWCWLLANATHQPMAVFRGKGGRQVNLEAGQLVISTVNGVDGLSRKRARTLLERFTKLAMISVETRRDTGHTITIKKWREYQHLEETEEGEGPNKGTYKGQTKAKQRPTAQEGLEGLEDSKKDSSYEESKESCASGAPDDRRAVADLVPADGRSVPRKERYPTKAKLPRDGRSIRWPVEFEAAWQAYPVRPEDTREACYAHWRRHVVDNRVDPALIVEHAEAWGMLLSGYEYRIGFLRWCREALWNQAPPKRREEPKTNGQLVAEAIARQRRGEDWNPFGVDDNEREPGTLHEMHRDAEDFGPEGAAGSGCRTPGPDGAAGQNVVPLLAAGGFRRL